ncbi:MAG: hypothetical protein RIS43_854, partial [Actinomycetota bacterium]
QLYKQTPLEEQFSINAVALVHGQPQTLGVIELLQVFLNHRIEVVRRRSEFRRKKAQDRLHLVEGLLIAIVDIDEVIQVIRASEDTAEAREKLMSVFDLSEIQTNYILEMPLRRLTKFSKIEIEKERDELTAEIKKLTTLLSDEKAIRNQVADELTEVANKYGTPRRTVLQEDDGSSVAVVDLEVADDPVRVALSSTGLLARFAPDATFNNGNRTKHDLAVSAVTTTARGTIGVVTSKGRVHRINVIEIPTLVASDSSFSMKGGGALKEFVTFDKGEVPLALVTLDEKEIIALGTAQGVVKRVSPEVPKGDVWEIIRLEKDDYVVGAGVTTSEKQHLGFITSDAQLLHFEASAVRPQGRAAGGMAGIKLSDDAKVIHFFVSDADAFVVTVAGTSNALPGTDNGTCKVSALSDFPMKGRATGGVRAHTLRKNEDILLFAGVARGSLRAASASGGAVDLPTEISKRDATGTPVSGPIAAIAGGEK